jgi:DNA-binding PadR family transcriptional regulator
VSVRSSLLAILTIGPAYGFQLHGELESRTAGRRTVNVGQIYGTLERLVKQDAIESAGTTADGLPLYRITPLGESEALLWLLGTDSAIGEEWNDLVDRVLIASSLPHVDAFRLIADYREQWRAVGQPSTAPRAPSGQAPTGQERTGQERSGQERLGAGARLALASAALAWLDEAEALLSGGPGALFEHGLSEVRPKRGRRPAATVMTQHS